MMRKKFVATAAALSLAALFAFALQSCAPFTPGCQAGQRSGGATAGGCSATGALNGKLLVFTKTGAFRHQSIPAAIAAVRQLALEHQITADFTEDGGAFTDANLAQYRAVMFLLTSGSILDTDQQLAFERYVRTGGGFVGVHSASDTEYEWSWYGGLVGAFQNITNKHSRVTQATIHVEDPGHPSTAELPTTWVRTDEWYNFASNPRGLVHVLLTVDETTYTGGIMGADHPIAWYHLYDGGRAWYTALGHTVESYSEPLFLAHLWGGIQYAIGGAASPTGTTRRGVYPVSAASILRLAGARVGSVPALTRLSEPRPATCALALIQWPAALTSEPPAAAGGAGPSATSSDVCCCQTCVCDTPAS